MGNQTEYSQKNYQHIPALNFAVESLAGQATPSASNVGKVYLNSVTGNLEVIISSTVVGVLTRSGQIVDGDIKSTAAIQLSKLAQNPLDRSLHTGTQTASTISDFTVTVRSSRLDQMAAPTASVGMNGQKLTGLADGVAVTDATTLQQVTNMLAAAVNGHDYKDAARVAVTSNVNIASPGASLDGVAMSAGDRVMLPAQTDGTQNGLYNWNGSATPMTRTTDADASVEVTNGMAVDITAGTMARNRYILTTPDAITLGTTSLTFQAIPVGQTYVGGTGITVSGNTISIQTVTVANGGTGATTAAGARANLGTNQAGGLFAIGTLVAGTDLDVVHNLGTQNIILQVRNATSKRVVGIDVRSKDANTATVNADVGVASGTLELLALPVG